MRMTQRVHPMTVNRRLLSTPIGSDSLEVFLTRMATTQTRVMVSASFQSIRTRIGAAKLASTHTQSGTDERGRRPFDLPLLLLSVKTLLSIRDSLSSTNSSATQSLSAFRRSSPAFQYHRFYSS